MPPRHWWWLYETLGEAKAKRKLPAREKRAILDALRGNDQGWW